MNAMAVAVAVARINSRLFMSTSLMTNRVTETLLDPGAACFSAITEREGTGLSALPVPVRRA
jgi:hypothetical protein